MTLCAIISGCEIVEPISMHTKARRSFFEYFLELSSGIPSADIFHNVLNTINPAKLIACFHQSIKGLKTKFYDIIAIKGKALIGIADKANHLVNAWSVENQIYFGQLKTTDKSKEIAAIPALIKMLDSKGPTQEKLIKENMLDSIIFLLGNLSPTTPFPVSALTFILSREKGCTNENYKDVFFIDANQYYQQDKNQKYRIDEGIEAILNVYEVHDKIYNYLKELAI